MRYLKIKSNVGIVATMGFLIRLHQFNRKPTKFLEKEKERKRKDIEEKENLKKENEKFKNEIRNRMIEKIHSKFEIGKVYVRSDIKIELGKIYSEYNYPAPAKASDLMKYFNYSVNTKNINVMGKRKNCFIILDY